MKIQAYLSAHLKKRLEDHKALLVFDPEELYRDVVTAMASDKVSVVDGSASTIAGREQAMAAWCRLGADDHQDLGLIVYLPVAKPVSREQMQANPY